MNAKPWLKHYDQGVPHSLQPYPQKTLLDIVSETTSQRPDHPALLFKGSVMTYAQLEQLSNDFAHALIQMGVKKKDRVALVTAKYTATRPDHARHLEGRRDCRPDERALHRA